jgi:hypothetical protein
MKNRRGREVESLQRERERGKEGKADRNRDRDIFNSALPQGLVVNSIEILQKGPGVKIFFLNQSSGIIL